MTSCVCWRKLFSVLCLCLSYFRCSFNVCLVNVQCLLFVIYLFESHWDANLKEIQMQKSVFIGQFTALLSKVKRRALRSFWIMRDTLRGYWSAVCVQSREQESWSSEQRASFRGRGVFGHCHRVYRQESPQMEQCMGSDKALLLKYVEGRVLQALCFSNRITREEDIYYCLFFWLLTNKVEVYKNMSCIFKLCFFLFLKIPSYCLSVFILCVTANSFPIFWGLWPTAYIVIDFASGSLLSKTYQSPSGAGENVVGLFIFLLRRRASGRGSASQTRNVLWSEKKGFIAKWVLTKPKGFVSRSISGQTSNGVTYSEYSLVSVYLQETRWGWAPNICNSRASAVPACAPVLCFNVPKGRQAEKAPRPPTFSDSPLDWPFMRRPLLGSPAHLVFQAISESNLYSCVNTLSLCSRASSWISWQPSSDHPLSYVQNWCAHCWIMGIMGSPCWFNLRWSFCLSHKKANHVKLNSSKK